MTNDTSDAMCQVQLPMNEDGGIMIETDPAPLSDVDLVNNWLGISHLAKDIPDDDEESLEMASAVIETYRAEIKQRAARAAITPLAFIDLAFWQLAKRLQH